MVDQSLVRQQPLTPLVASSSGRTLAAGMTGPQETWRKRWVIKGFDVLQGALFGRWRGERVIALKGPSGMFFMHCSIMDRLCASPHAHGGAVVGVPVAAHRHLELELIVTGQQAIAHVKMSPVARTRPPCSRRRGPGPCCRRRHRWCGPGVRRLAMAAFPAPINRLGSQLNTSVPPGGGPAGRQIVGHAAIRNQAGCMWAPVMASMMV